MHILTDCLFQFTRYVFMLYGQCLQLSGIEILNYNITKIISFHIRSTSQTRTSLIE